jgi:8-oxo-dGTP diphosphatase
VKTLVLVRHAHRDTSDREKDNGLTEKGRRQAKAVRRFFKERFGKETPLLVSSPKKRCLETLEPLAERRGLRIRVDEHLLEGSRLSERTAAFAAWWRERAPALVVACSHGDWIPAFLARALGAEIELKKGGWAELTWEEGRVRLECLLQTLPE